MKLRKAVIPVAGLGTRFLPATKTVPKELLPIVDIPSIQYVVQEAVDAGIQEIIFVTGRGKDSIEDHFDEAPELEQVLAERGQTELVEMLRRIKEMTEVVSVRQKKPLGLGHAVLCARDLVGDEPFAVMQMDERQVEELLLTAAQSLFAVAILANLSFSVGEALILFVLFGTQLLIPDPRFRYYFSFLYIVLAIGMVVLKRDYREGVASLFARAGSPKALKK